MKPTSATPSGGDSDADTRVRPGVCARVVLTLLRGYKLLLSPLFAGSCRFLPSCADYAAEAVRRHGAIAGALLAAGRLLRCHPFCRSGHDPVPERIDWWPFRGRRSRPDCGQASTEVQ